MVILGWGMWPAQAGELGDRIAHFPHWEKKPAVSAVAGDDLVYPAWMAGTWNVTSTLVDMKAPLAPQLTTPGFEGNRRYLDQPVEFQVRFVPEDRYQQINFLDFRALFALGGQSPQPGTKIVADRGFNGLNIGQAMLGKDAILSVRVDPSDPNRQTTQLRDGEKLVSVVTQRNTETPDEDKFIATEITQQIFETKTQIYLNEVETTTAYNLISEPDRHIVGDQITAIFLSPRDPNYFKASGRPVALYRYQLELWPGR